MTSPWEQRIGQTGEAVLATTVKDGRPGHLQLCDSSELLRKDINKTFSSVLTLSCIKIMHICPPTRLFELLKKKKKKIYIYIYNGSFVTSTNTELHSHSR